MNCLLHLHSLQWDKPPPQMRTPQLLNIVRLVHLVLPNTITKKTQAGHYFCILRPVHGSIRFALSRASKESRLLSYLLALLPYTFLLNDNTTFIRGLYPLRFFCTEGKTNLYSLSCAVWT